MSGITKNTLIDKEIAFFTASWVTFFFKTQIHTFEVLFIFWSSIFTAIILNVLNSYCVLQAHEGVLYKMWITDHDHSSDGEEETQRGKAIYFTSRGVMAKDSQFRDSLRFLLFSFIYSQIIEKRRRDRINNSLSELRRLVPTAFEKQVRSCFYRNHHSEFIRVLTGSRLNQ